MPPQYTQPSISIRRAVLLEKKGHKTLSEKQQWIRDNQIIVHTKVTGASNYVGFTGTGNIAYLGGIDTAGINTGIGYSALSTATGSLGFTGIHSTITGGHNNIAIGSSAFSTFITEEEFSQLGKVGTKRWSYDN